MTNLEDSTMTAFDDYFWPKSCSCILGESEEPDSINKTVVITINDSNTDVLDLGSIDCDVVKSDEKLHEVLMKEYTMNNYMKLCTYLFKQLIVQSKTIDNVVDKMEYILSCAYKLNDYYEINYPSRYLLDYSPIQIDVLALAVEHSTVKILRILMVNSFYGNGKINAGELIELSKKNSPEMQNFIQSYLHNIDPKMNVGMLILGYTRSSATSPVFPHCQLNVNFMNYYYDKFMKKMGADPSQTYKISTDEDDQKIQKQFEFIQSLISRMPEGSVHCYY